MHAIRRIRRIITKLMYIGLNVNLYLREYFCPRKLGKFIRGSRGVITIFAYLGHAN